MSTAEETALDLDAVADNLALTVLADRGNGLYCALEAVEGVSNACRNEFERLVVLVSTNFTSSHFIPPLANIDLDVTVVQVVAAGVEKTHVNG